MDCKRRYYYINDVFENNVKRNEIKSLIQVEEERNLNQLVKNMCQSIEMKKIRKKSSGTNLIIPPHW